jgi:hypothetical protein
MHWMLKTAGLGTYKAVNQRLFLTKMKKHSTPAEIASPSGRERNDPIHSLVTKQLSPPVLTRHRDAQSFNVLFDLLAPLLDRMGGKEFNDVILKLGIDQTNHPFTHARNRVVRILTVHILPVQFQE